MDTLKRIEELGIKIDSLDEMGGFEEEADRYRHVLNNEYETYFEQTKKYFMK